MRWKWGEMAKPAGMRGLEDSLQMVITTSSSADRWLRRHQLFG